MSARALFHAFLKQHGLRRHVPDSVERDLQIDLLSGDLQTGADGHLWAEISKRINSGEKPPKKAFAQGEHRVRAMAHLSISRLHRGAKPAMWCEFIMPFHRQTMLYKSRATGVARGTSGNESRFRKSTGTTFRDSLCGKTLRYEVERIWMV